MKNAVTESNRQSSSETTEFKNSLSSSNKNSPNGQKPRSSQITALTLIISLILVVFLPTGFNHQVANSKNLVIFITAILLTLYFCWASFRRRQFQITKSSLTAPLLTLGSFTLIATLINFPLHPQENLFNNAGLFLSLVIISVLGSTLIKVKNSKLIVTTITGIAAIIGLITFLKASSFLFPQYNLPKFSTLQIGTPLVTLAFLLIAAAGCATMYVKKGKLIKPYNIFLPLIILGLLSVFIVAFHEYNTSTPLFMNPRLSLQTTLNSLEMHSPGLEAMNSDLEPVSFSQKTKQWLIGSGSESYNDIYNLYKPQWVLQTPLKDFNFTTGFNLPLTTIPTLGLLFTISWFWLLIRSFLEFKNQNGANSHLFLMPAAAFGLQFFIPADPVIILLTAILIAFSASYSSQKLIKLNPVVERSSSKKMSFARPLYYLILIIFIGLSIWSSLGLFRSYAAFNYDKAALTARAQINNSPLALNSYIQDSNRAAQLSPHLDLLQRHAAIANLIAATDQFISENSPFADTDPTFLVNNSLAQAQTATTLRPNRALNWVTLASLYQEIANLKLTTDPVATYNFALSAYGRAILLEPFNINNYLQMGQIFLALDQPAEALVFFEKAVIIDPESAAAHLYLGNIYRQSGQKEAAYLEYQKSLALLNSADPTYLDNLQLLQNEMNSLGLSPSQIPGTATSLTPVLEK